MCSNNIFKGDLNKGDTMNVARTGGIIQANSGDTAQNAQKAKDAQEQRAKETVRENQKQNEQRNPAIPGNGEINITA